MKQKHHTFPFHKVHFGVWVMHRLGSWSSSGGILSCFVCRTESIVIWRSLREKKKKREAKINNRSLQPRFPITATRCRRGKKNTEEVFTAACLLTRTSMSQKVFAHHMVLQEFQQDDKTSFCASVNFKRAFCPQDHVWMSKEQKRDKNAGDEGEGFFCRRG